MKAVLTASMTADEFLALPYDDGARWRELIEGELIVCSPSWTHNSAQLSIVFALETWVRAAAGRGGIALPAAVRLDDRNVCLPDVLWYRAARVPARGDVAPFPIPDIAVEVRSPSTWRFDIGAKKRNYERHGVAELWLVDIEADVVLVFRRAAPHSTNFDVSLELTTADTLTSPLLPGFALGVGDIFAD